ncbi:MAG: transposase [Planctomycetales bacterium]
MLINKTLDDRIPDDHMVRVIAEVLGGYNWAPWEAQHHAIIGQPPIHPRILAGVWLYSLRQNVHSSRKMEYMTRDNVDFMWLASGPPPDHSTFSNFRKKFGKQLKDLFKYVATEALRAGFLSLVDVAFDGTRVKANNSRYETCTAVNLTKLARDLKNLRAQVEVLVTTPLTN